jgi:hypothetical protein
LGKTTDPDIEADEKRWGRLRDLKGEIETARPEGFFEE